MENQIVAVEPQNSEVMPQAYSLPNKKQIEEYKGFLKNYDKFVDSMLKKGSDFGEIPGVEKPTLLKPGAEKLEKLFFLTHEKICTEKVIDPDYAFVKYSYLTKIYNKFGKMVATCEGSCNSHEKKYRYYTKFENEATAEEKANGKLVQRTSKAGKPYSVYILEKKDFYDMENTIMKMAQKRSYVGAILEATNSSSRFTQDVEDMDLGNKETAKTEEVNANVPVCEIHKKPMTNGQYGYYCRTKLEDGTWCKFKPAQKAETEVIGEAIPF